MPQKRNLEAETVFGWDPNAPLVDRTVEGETVRGWAVRCRVPFELDCGQMRRVTPPTAPENREVHPHVQDWTHARAAFYAVEVGDSLGEPDSVTEDAVVWSGGAGFKVLSIMDEAVEHSIPVDHVDYVRGTVSLQVEPDLMDALIEATRAMTFDVEAGTVTARGATLMEAAVAITLAQDAVEGILDGGPTEAMYVTRLENSVVGTWFTNPLEERAADGWTVEATEDSNDTREPMDLDDDRVLIEGIASSTSVDWYGTEMNRDALEDMALQMRAGVSYVPSHWASEWDQEIGVTVHAEVVATSVTQAADNSEQGYVLKSIAALDMNEELSLKLVRKVDAGRLIGQSIGGWFTEVLFVASEDGDLERVIILKVELDHLAVTRGPANPDSWIANLRTRVERAISDRKQVRVQRVDAEGEAAAMRSKVEPVEPVEPTTETDSLPILDVTRETGHDAGVTTGVDVHRDVSGVENGINPTISTEDDLMDETTKALLNSINDGVQATRTTLSDLDERVKAIEARDVEPAPAPVVEPEPAPEVVDARDTEIEALKAQVTEQDVAIRKLAAEPMRRGRAGQSRTVVGPGNRSTYDVFVAELKTDGNRSMAAVFSGDAFAKRATADLHDGDITRAKLERDLGAVINAALADGVISDPSTRSVWH